MPKSKLYERILDERGNAHWLVVSTGKTIHRTPKPLTGKRKPFNMGDEIVDLSGQTIVRYTVAGRLRKDGKPDRRFKRGKLIRRPVEPGVAAYAAEEIVRFRASRARNPVRLTQAHTVFLIDGERRQRWGSIEAWKRFVKAERYAPAREALDALGVRYVLAKRDRNGDVGRELITLGRLS